MKKLLLLLLVFSTALTNAQTKSVKGVVTDDNGTPIPGVSVGVKGKATIQTLTNEKGLYEINVPDPAKDVLVFTSIGYASIEMKVNNRTSLNIQLTVAVKIEEAVVVSAMGLSRTKKSLTYSSQNLNPKTLTEARDINFLNGLSGKVAGLQITGTGQPGGSVRLILRGPTSLTGTNQPLIVVDGVPVENNPGDAGNLDYGNAIANLNPDDIETITVLEGPNGAALYGSKASSGAILITLKKGKTGGDGSLGIDVNQSLQLLKITQFPEYQNVYGEGSSMRLASGNGNNVNRNNGGVNMGTATQSWGAPMLGQPYNSYLGVPIKGGYRPQSNNISDLYQTAITNSSNISMTKADATSSFRLSYGFTKGSDVINNINNTRKHNLTLTASKNLGKLLKIDTRVVYTNWNTKNRMVKNLDPGNPLAAYVYMPRSVQLDGFLPYKDANGNALATGQALGGGGIENPYWSINANSNEDTRSALNGAITTTVALAKTLKFRGQISGDLTTTENYIYKELGGRIVPLGSYSNDLKRQNNWYFEGVILYNKKLKNNLSIDGLVGASLDKRNVLDRYASISSLITHNMPSISNSTSIPTAGESLIRTNQQSLFAKATLSYKEFLFLDLSARNEWSSTLPLANNSFFYPMIGGGFVFSEFIKSRDLLSSGKIRVSYAKVGGSTSAYQLFNTYSSQGIFLGNPILAYTTQLKNAELKPEQQISKEAGLDLSFFKDKLNISATYYHNSTINQIVNVQLPVETGFQNRIINAGEIQNKGFEFTASALPLQTKKFTWRTGLNFSTNKNQVVSLLPNLNRIQLGGRLGMSVNALVGQPYGIQIGTRPYRIGDTVLVGTNGRAIAQTNVITGNPNPKWIGGFTNTFNYKGFSFQVTLTVKWGGVIFSESYGRAMFAGTTVKSLEGRDDYFFSNFVLGESDNERRNIGQTVGTTVTRYRDSVRMKGIAYKNAYLGKTNSSGVLIVDRNGNYMVGDKFLGWVYPQLVLGNDKVANDVPYLTFDATSVRISEIIIGYTLPKKALGKSFVKGVYVALTGRNVWQIFQKTPIGIDPEAAAGTTNGTTGIESGGAFPYAIMGLTVKLAF